MALPNDLMSFGESPFLARVYGSPAVTATAFGTSAGSANQIPAGQKLTLCLTGTSSFVLPQIGGDGAANGALLTDEYIIANMTAASIKVYAANTAQGSAVTMYGGAASTAGTTGVTIPAGLTGQFNSFSPSTWICGISSV